jgi:hypothetical protein
MPQRGRRGRPNRRSPRLETPNTATAPHNGDIYLDIDPATMTVRLIKTLSENHTDTESADRTTVLGDIVTERRDQDSKDAHEQLKRLRKEAERNKKCMISTQAELAKCKLQLRAAQNDIRLTNKAHNERHKNDESICNKATKEVSDIQAQYDHHRACTVSTSMVGLHISKAKADTDKANGLIKELRDTVKQLRETITKREKTIAVAESASLTTTQDLLEALSCPIGLTLFADAVACTDGHSYDRSAITSWMRYSTLSPLDGSQKVEIIGPDVCVNAVIAAIHRSEQYRHTVVE